MYVLEGREDHPLGTALLSFADAVCGPECLRNVEFSHLAIVTLGVRVPIKQWR